ncbi:MAG TPA: nitroreductase family deazaflavin-dependent oxidoreductase [Actinomycetota bacterium]
MLFGDEHVRRYRETGGEVGYHWNDVTTLILETTGRHSGKPRAKALIFGQDGDRYVVVASKGGAKRHPDWYLNLRDDPKVEVQVKDEVFRARARTAEGAERERLWGQMAEIWPAYNDYQRKTDQQIPVVVLERAEP